MSQKMTPAELFEQLSEEERSARIQHGLPGMHVADLSEFPFKFTAKRFRALINACEQWVASDPGRPQPNLFVGYARVLVGDYAGADAALANYERLTPLTPFGRMRFASLPGTEAAQLPQVFGEWPKEPAFFVACDAAFFQKFGLPLFRSLADKAPGCAVHLHLMAPAVQGLPPAALRLGLRLTVTREDPTEFISRHKIQPATYYHAARFVRFSEGLAAGAPVLISTDADGLVTADPRFLFASSGPAMRVRAGRIQPWNHFSACLVRGNGSALPYYQSVADIIRRLITNPFWGLDQYSLFAAYIMHKPSLGLYGPDIAGVDASTPGVFWFTAGKQKDALQDDPSPYAALFRKYS